MIEIAGLTKSYGSNTAIANLDLRVGENEIYGFLGPNGAGKSTTIKILMGLLYPSTGRVAVLGREVTANRDWVRAHVGYVPEQHFIYPWMSVREAVDFTSSFFPTWKDDISERLLKMFSIDTSQRVTTLSKGTLAKLALLFAMAHEPPVLILDEPTSGLDPIVRDEFLDMIVRYKSAGRGTVLLSSHIVGDLERVADMVGIIDDGNLLVSCDLDELRRRTKRIRIPLCDFPRFAASVPQIVRSQEQGHESLVTLGDYDEKMVAGICNREEIGSVVIEDMNLEDIFRDYIKGRRSA